MSHQPLDESYFIWLYSQVGDTRIKNRSRTYWNILRQLFKKEFIWFVPNDDNRVEDGKDLRYEFVDQSNLMDVDRDWMNLGCSMLEMLVGLSRRLVDLADGEPRDWFWHILRNLELADHNDSVSYNQQDVDDILDRVIWRTYEPDGRGGLFPLKNAQEDQRKVEIWYQFCAYILE